MNQNEKKETSRINHHGQWFFRVFTKLFFLGFGVFTSSCLFDTKKPLETVSADDGSIAVAAEIVKPSGVVLKKKAATAALIPTEVRTLIISDANDTISSSARIAPDQTMYFQTFGKIASLKIYRIVVLVFDDQNVLTHRTESERFLLKPGENKSVQLLLDKPFFTFLKMQFQKIPDSVYQVNILLDGTLSQEIPVTKSDSASARIDYIQTSASHRIDVELWARWYGYDTVFYQGSLNWSFPAGKDTSFQLTLKRVGPAAPLPGNIVVQVTLISSAGSDVKVDIEEVPGLTYDTDGDGIVDSLDEFPLNPNPTGDMLPPTSYVPVPSLSSKNLTVLADPSVLADLGSVTATVNQSDSGFFVSFSPDGALFPKPLYVSIQLDSQVIQNLSEGFLVFHKSTTGKIEGLSQPVVIGNSISFWVYGFSGFGSVSIGQLPGLPLPNLNMINRNRILDLKQKIRAAFNQLGINSFSFNSDFCNSNQDQVVFEKFKGAFKDGFFEALKNTLSLRQKEFQILQGRHEDYYLKLEIGSGQGPDQAVIATEDDALSFEQELGDQANALVSSSNIKNLVLLIIYDVRQLANISDIDPTLSQKVTDVLNELAISGVDLLKDGLEFQPSVELSNASMITAVEPSELGYFSVSPTAPTNFLIQALQEGTGIKVQAARIRFNQKINFKFSMKMPTGEEMECPEEEDFPMDIEDRVTLDRSYTPLPVDIQTNSCPSDWTLVPKSSLSMGPNGTGGNGLRADYDDGTVVLGEGPIWFGPHEPGWVPSYYPADRLADGSAPALWQDISGIGGETLTGYFKAPKTGLVSFSAGGDDYGSLNIPGLVSVVNDNNPGSVGATVPMQGGIWYPITVGYKNRWGTNGFSFSYMCQ